MSPEPVGTGGATVAKGAPNDYWTMCVGSEYEMLHEMQTMVNATRLINEVREQAGAEQREELLPGYSFYKRIPVPGCTSTMCCGGIATFR